MSDELRAIAHVNWGLWIANCPRPGCSNAEHFGAHPVTGHVGGLKGVTFECGTATDGCGLRCRSVWPPNVEDIERLLAQRPAPQTRNWLPGEDLATLLAENLEHGIIPADLAELVPAGGTVMAIVGDRIVSDALPSGQRAAIGAGD